MPKNALACVQVVQCMLLLKAKFSIELIPDLQHCRVEVASGEGLVRVYQQREDSIKTTPQSVLHSTQALSFQSARPGRVGHCFPADAC